MKAIALIFCVLLLSSCTQNRHVWCNCYGTNHNMSFDYGIQHAPSASANQARCDTDGSHYGYDTCLVQIVDR